MALLPTLAFPASAMVNVSGIVARPISGWF